MIKLSILLLTSLIFSVSAFAQNLARFSDIQPGMVDGGVEQSAVKIANQRAIDLRCPEDYTRSVIISRKWQQHFNKKGAIDGRIIHMELYCTFPEGRCAMTDMVFKQKRLEDGSYSRKLYFTGMGDMFTVDCE